jgi:hypothetical protein
MRLFRGVFLSMFVSTTSGLAQDLATTCALNGAPYQLASDTVVWSMALGSGQSCIRGLRTQWVTLENTKVVVPPQFGQVKLEGPAFLYKTNSDFRGQDSFSILVSGKINKINGSSTIQIVVYVR